LADDQTIEAPDLSTIPTLALLAEVDRRARASAPPQVLFFGVWPGSRAGHFVRDRHGSMPRADYEGGVPKARDGGLYPWGCGHEWRQPGPQDEGKLWLWHHPQQPMTLLLAWDRSEDRRGNCCSTFLVFAHVTPEHGLELARAAFPRVFERIEAHLGRALELAGPAPVSERR
jgi:hypothetical protein